MVVRAFRRSVTVFGAVIVLGLLLPPPPSYAASKLSPPAIKTEINIDRQHLRLNVLRTSSSLDRIAQQRVADMIKNKYFSHTSPSGQTFVTLLSQQTPHWRRIGETLGMNFQTAKESVRAWDNSPLHRSILHDRRYTHLGVAIGNAVINRQKKLLVVVIYGQL